MFRIPRKICLVLCIPLGLSAARAWQDSITLPTYLEAPPDPNPVFDLLSPGHGFFPYAGRTNLTSQKAPQSWRLLHLENEFLACTFLPDLGGHLYSCIDKLNGRAMFHANPSIKKALIGFRGAWVSLGIEMNFPMGHSRATVSPVDFGFRQEEHSATVWVGTVDRVTGMEWRSEFVLRDGRAALEQNVTLSNPTEGRHPYYWWNNAAVELLPDTQFVFPTHLMLLHGKNILESWPVNTSGVDQSVVRNIKDGAGFFAYQSREPFFGAYQPSTRTATLHVADPRQVPGKKLWTWGTEEDAKIRSWLSDNNSQYVEIQAGLFTTQEEFHFLPPHHARQFTEYWMAARGLSGIDSANLDGALAFRRKSGEGKTELVAELNVTRRIPGARIRILSGSAAALQETAELDPSVTFSRAIPNPAAAPYRFELADASGTVLLGYTEGVYDASPAAGAKLGPLPQPDWNHANTAAGYLARGNFNELQSQFHFAQGDYAAGLRSFPESAELKKAAGRLAAIQKRYDEAVPLLAGAAAALPPDAEIRYYEGVALAGEGKEAEARKRWESVSADAQFGVPAGIELAASLARAGAADQALAELSHVLAKDSSLAQAGKMQIPLLQRGGYAREARERLAHWLALDPIDPFLRWQNVLLNRPDETLWQHLAADPERVLDIADEYLRLGMYLETLPVLAHNFQKVPENQEEPGLPLPQNDALVAYYRAYARMKAGMKGTDDFRLAQSLPLRYIFTNRATAQPVLRAALETNPDDASAHWLLGLMYLDGGAVDDALAEIQKARSTGKNVPGLHALLSRILLDVKKDSAAAAAVQKEGLKDDPSNAAVQKGLEGVLKRSEMERLAIAPAASAPKAAPAGGTAKAAPLTIPPLGGSPPPPPAANPTGTPDELANLALLRAASGQLSSGIALFTAGSFPQEKQPEDVRRAYIELQLQQLRQQAATRDCRFAEHGFMSIGEENKSLVFTMYGFDSFLKEARFQYYLGAVEAACGDEKNARKRWAKVARANENPDSANFAFPALAAARLGEPGARKRLEDAAAEVSKLLQSAAPAARGMLLYSEGMLLQAMGQNDKALAAFESGSKSPDRVESQYLNLLALRELATAK